MLSAARSRQGAVVGAWETEPLLLAMDKPLAISNLSSTGHEIRQNSISRHALASGFTSNEPHSRAQFGRKNHPELLNGRWQLRATDYSNARCCPVERCSGICGPPRQA